MATLKVKLGNKVLEISTDKGQKEMIKTLSFWSQVPERCGLCKSPNIGLNYRAVTSKKDGKNYNYYGLKCLDCGAVLTFGEHDEAHGGGFFIRDWDTETKKKLKEEDKWSIYQSQEAIEATSQEAIADKATPSITDEIPF